MCGTTGSSEKAKANKGSVSQSVREESHVSTWRWGRGDGGREDQDQDQDIHLKVGASGARMPVHCSSRPMFAAAKWILEMEIRTLKNYHSKLSTMVVIIVVKSESRAAPRHIS